MNGNRQPRSGPFISRSGQKFFLRPTVDVYTCTCIRSMAHSMLTIECVSLQGSIQKFGNDQEDYSESSSSLLPMLRGIAGNA